LAGGPDVDGFREVHRFVERAGLDAEIVAVERLVPQPRAAIGAQGAADAPPAVGAAGPEFRRALRDADGARRHGQRHAEGGCRLVPAFGAVADIERQRFGIALVAHRAALAATAFHPSLPRRRPRSIANGP